MDHFWQDLKYAVRMLQKSPTFTAIAILTLALGIGANSAIFSLINAVMLKSLPVPHPEQLVLLSWTGNWPPQLSETGGESAYAFSYPAFAELHQGSTALSSMFAFVPLGFTPQNTTVLVNGEPTLADGMMVSGQFFSGLEVSPALGRGITEEDERPGAPRVAVISYVYWTRQFARDRSILGRSVELNGVPFTIVGVAPNGFHGVQPGTGPDFWIAFSDLSNLRPWGMEPYKSKSVFTASDWICLNIMARLKTPESKSQAQAGLDTIYQRFLTQDWKPDNPKDIPHLSLVAAGQGLNDLRKAYSQPLYILMGAVGLVLLIACANLATLLLARAAGRQKEMSVRMAMGAGRARVVRQLLTESVLTSIIGGALGLIFAFWGTHALLALISSGDSPVILDVTPDLRTLGFTALITMLTGIVFGAAPAFRAARVDLASSMKETASNVSPGGRNLLAKSLVIAQVAASLVLMIGAGLLVRTLRNLENKNLGFNQSHLLLFGLDPTREGYQGARLQNFFTQLTGQIRALPGVQSATLYEFEPFSGWSNNTEFEIIGSSRKVENKMVRFATVGPDFFSAMQVPIVLGRGILDSDSASAPKVAVVNETFVKNFFAPDENPIGHQFSVANAQFEIVGVSKDIELTDLHAKPGSKAFLPYLQVPTDFLGTMYYEVRAGGEPLSIVSEIREAVRRLDPDVPLFHVKTQEDQTSDALSQERVFARLSSFFGLAALLLACIGLYGTMAYTVTRKTHEIGIRMALGADPGDVLRMVIQQGLLLVLVGVAAGIAAGFGLTRLFAGLIYGVSATDPLTFVVLSVVLILVAALACAIPARRAMRVDPLVALRYE
ncbi:MAG TPA: ABC transporter permease [Candidatus Acidoferrales bacterium]|nr:ABC transporter permease [Candidatus Acidoferrales bacterium]